MIWLMDNLNQLGPEVARWPNDPDSGGYYETGTRAPSYNGAYFEEPIGFHAEVTWRLEQCGKDGRLAGQHYVEGTDIFTLADLTHAAPGKVTRRVGRVLAYICGYRRKSRTYKEFKRSYSPKYGR